MGGAKILQKVMPTPSVIKIVIKYCGVRGRGALGGAKSYKNNSASLTSVINPVFVYGRVESRTVLPMVINTFKPKYAVQRYLGLH